ncbi:HET-domain-containing protein, partial [Lojkania enalia]
WLEECYEHHKDCQIERHTGDRLPTRVIDVATSDINGMPCPRLVDGKGRSEKFAALSYCWGGESILTLNAQTEAELRAGLPMEQFPPTLRDAIIVTQHLRLKYLWIDAVCIKQDSAEDWNIEATKMRDIYKGAIVTIAAAAASKSSDGIFRHRTVGRTLCKLPWLNGESPCPTVSLRSGSEIRQDPARSSLIHTRAWTLQETLLAPRTLYLGSHIITFECSQGQIDESGRSTKGMAIRAFSHYGLETFQTFLTGYTFFTQGLVTTPGGLSMTYYDLWREIITQYSKRHLTKVSDTLPALAGLANDFNHVTGDKYFAGLWMGDIIRSLCWMTFPGGNSAKNTRHVNEYLAPSWSWASVYGLPLGFYGHESTEDSGFKPLAEVIGIRAAPAGQDPFGRVVDGELVLRA